MTAMSPAGTTSSSMNPQTSCWMASHIFMSSMPARSRIEKFWGTSLPRGGKCKEAHPRTRPGIPASNHVLNLGNRTPD